MDAHIASAAAADRASAARARAVRAQAVLDEAEAVVKAKAKANANANADDKADALAKAFVCAFVFKTWSDVADQCATAATDCTTAALAADAYAVAVVAADAAAAASYSDYDARVAPVTAAKSEEWQQFMKSRSDIGMFTIMFMHNEAYPRDLLSYWMISLLFLLLLAQVMFPILLLVNTPYLFDGTSSCPNSADALPRVVAFAIGCIYQTRIVFSYFSKSCEPSVEMKRIARDSVWRDLALFLDKGMNTYYEGFVYITNLLIVFFTADPLGMVLNALAFEFILQLDDVVKEKYISIHAKYHDTIIQVYDATFELTSEARRPEFLTGSVLSLAFGYIVRLTTQLYVVIYLPWCKPGNLSKS